MTTAIVTTNHQTPSRRRERAEAIHAAAHAGKLYSAPAAPLALFATTLHGLDLINHADRKTAATLAYLAKCGDATALDLARYAAADRLVFTVGAMYEEADKHRQTAAALLESEDYKNAERIRNRISTPDEQREILTAYTDRIRAEAAEHVQQALSIERRAAGMTFSPRADLVMVAAHAIRRHGEHAPQVTAAIRAAIRAEKKRSGLNHTITAIIRETTAEDRQRHSTFTKKDGTTVYEALPHITRKGTADGYTTIEHRAAKVLPDGTSRPDGLYLIHHRQTAKAAISFEVYTDPENGHDIPDSNNGLNAVLVEYDWYRLEHLADLANLTQTDRKVVYQVARSVYSQTDRKPTETDTEYINRMWTNAQRNHGIYAKDTQSAERDRIETSLAATPAERKRRQRITDKLKTARAQMEQETESQSRAAVDMLAWAMPEMCNEPQPLAAIPFDFRWKETYNAADAVTVSKVFTPTCQSQTAPRAAHEPTQEEREKAAQNLAYWTRETERDSRRAAKLEPLAEAAEQTAREAAEAAQTYSKHDMSNSARNARKAATAAARAAETARAKATAARHDAEQAAEHAAYYAAIVSR